MRIDKLLANKAYGSRKEVHQLIKRGLVTVNDVVVKKKDQAVNLESDIVVVNSELVNYQMEYYIKLHKPQGYITAVEDPSHPVVMDLLPPEYKKLGVFPVGRLDKDTEGLLLLTNDGIWGHSIINGHKSVPKVYYLRYDGELSQEGLERIREGIVLGDGTQCKAAQLELLGPGEGHITIEEGKYHQVKRMVGAVGGTVTYLKRLTVGGIDLTGIEEPNTFLELSDDEVELFR